MSQFEFQGDVILPHDYAPKIILQSSNARVEVNGPLLIDASITSTIATPGHPEPYTRRVQGKIKILPTRGIPVEITPHGLRPKKSPTSFTPNVENIMGDLTPKLKVYSGTIIRPTPGRTVAALIPGIHLEYEDGTPIMHGDFINIDGVFPIVIGGHDDYLIFTDIDGSHIASLHGPVKIYEKIYALHL